MSKEKTEIELETGVSNRQRAKWAVQALKNYLKGKKAEEDAEDNIGDLIADLLHLAEVKGFDADNLVRKAVGHFQYERALGKEASL